MRKTWTSGAVAAVSAFLCSPVLGQDATGSLYDQEGTTADGYGTIDATGQGPAGDAGSTSNWKYQYGSGAYTGIYKASGWMDVSDTGDSTIDIECDIEMFYTETFSGNKVYFHIGDPFAASAADKTAVVDGTFVANNGMYIGISFDGTSKTEADMLMDGGNYTGEVANALVGTVDVLGRDISAEKFNAKFSLDWSNDAGATWSGPQAPVSFGTGASGTILNTLWWLVNNGDKGSYQLKYNIELLMPADQADGWLKSKKPHAAPASAKEMAEAIAASFTVVNTV